MGIAMGMKDAGAGFIEMTSDWNTPDPGHRIRHGAADHGGVRAGRWCSR